MKKRLEYNTEFKNYEKEMQYLVKTWATDQHLRAYDLQEPEDILQEIHLSFWRALEDYNKGDVDVTFRTYWNRCVKNHMINLKDRAMRKVSGRAGGIVWQEDLSSVDDFEIAPDTLEPKDVEKDVNRAVEATLDTDERKLYELYFVDEKAMEEIAVILDTHKMSISRKIDKLINKPQLIKRLGAYGGLE